MDIWIQNRIISSVLTPLTEISMRFSEKSRDRIFVASGFMIFLMTFISGSQYTSFRYLYVYAFDCLMLGIMILCSLRQHMKPVIFDKKLLILNLVFGLSALIFGFFLDTDYLSHAILSLIAYPVIYIVWNNSDVIHVFGLLLKISKLSFLFYFLVHFLFFPIERLQYRGFIDNQNYNSFFLTLFACCFFLELIIGKKDKRDYVFLLICYGLNGALLYCTNSRTGLLAVLLSHGFSIILLLMILKKTFWKLYSKRIIAMLLSVFLFIPVTIFTFHIPKFCLGTIQQIFFQTDTDQNKESLLSAFSDAFTDIQGSWENKTSTEGKDLATVTTGRIDIWKAYLQHLRFTGHAKLETFPITTVVGGIEHKRTFSPHMMILQYAYQLGILAGLSFLGINLITGIKSILFALKYGKREIIALFPFMISIAYGVIAMLSLASSFTVLISLYYFLALTPLVKKGFGEETPDSISICPGS